MPLYTQDDVTVLIAARNAQETIRRAVASVRAQSSCPIVLVDDFSEDDTVNLARLEVGSGLTVVRPPYHGALGFTRQCGLEAIQTPLTLLLDADDAFLQGRIARFVAQMNAQPAELWADELLLFDGASDSLIRHIPIPDFIATKPVPYRLFERNYLPGIGQVGYRTKFARSVRYDTELHGPEDIDLVLRMMLDGGHFAYSKVAGYVMYSYPFSVSRNLDRQKAMYARSLAKFPRSTVENFYLRHGASRRESILGVLLVLVHRGEYEEALEILADFDRTGDQIEGAELVNGSVAFDNNQWRWRVSFYKGSLYLKVGLPFAALGELSEAVTQQPSADALNNLGCALKLVGRFEESYQSFVRALEIKPNYLDALRNLNDEGSHFVTLPELRTLSSRDLY
jgi:glycosyltransferase involved in cell wall biosynthesis